MFSAHHADRSGQDLSHRIDRALGAIARLLVRHRQAAERDACEQEWLEQRIAAQLLQTELSPDVVSNAFRESQAGAGTEGEGAAERRAPIPYPSSRKKNGIEPTGYGRAPAAGAPVAWGTS